MRRLSQLMVSAIVLCGMSQAIAQDGPPTDPSGTEERFLDDRERGWFWYEEDPEPEPIPEPPPPPPPGGGGQTSESPPPLSTAWLQQELESARIRAMDDPSPENIEYHSYLMQIAMDKAKKFALASVEVNARNPMLDGSASRPLNSFGRNNVRRQREDTARDTLKSFSGGIGIWYFYSSTCGFCQKQNYPLASFAEQYDIPVMAISIDGNPSQEGFFPDWVPDMGQAAQLDVIQTPTMYVFKPPNTLLRLSVGLQTNQDLQTRLLRMADQEGWISHDEFELAIRGLKQNYLLDAVDNVKESIDWDNPEEAVRALREASQYGVERSSTDLIGVPGISLKE